MFAIIVLLSFSVITLYGAIIPHEGMHQSGCLSSLAFNQPCLSSSLDGHLKLFSMLTLVLPIIFIFMVVFSIFTFSLPTLTYFYTSLSAHREGGGVYLYQLITWLSRTEHSPTIA